VIDASSAVASFATAALPDESDDLSMADELPDESDDLDAPDESPGEDPGTSPSPSLTT
jgi:hypothetical protein